MNVLAQWIRVILLACSPLSAFAGDLPHSGAAHTARYSEADMLPVRSSRLTPGAVSRRAIKAPGLTAIFLIGDDARSRAWLVQRIDVLRKLNAIGLIVNVESPVALASLRQLAAGLTLAPTPCDDFAERLNLQHYPVLITSTAIEQ